MKRLLLIMLLISSLGFSQDFPKDWIGNYKGEMVLAFSQRPNDTLDVEFIMQEKEKDSVWSYTMIYHSEKYGDITKDYLIRSKTIGDRKSFELDEQNGIVMELTFMNNCFYGMYQVMGDIYSSTMKHNGDHLYFDLYAVPVKDPRVSKIESDEQPIEAFSYKPKLSQSVRLYKQ